MSGGGKRGRWQLLLIVALFGAPLLVAIALHWAGWQPARTQNYGQLLTPPRDLRSFKVRLDADALVAWQNDSERWYLIARAPAECDRHCWDALAMLPRLRLALGRFAPRLELLLLERAPPPERRQALRPMQFGLAEPPLPQELAHDPDAGPALWLVDPHGFLVMAYLPGYELDGVVKDLKRLIR